MPIIPPIAGHGSVPVHPDLDPGHPLVVFGDHRFCAGQTLDVDVMDGPHMHSQIELNFVLDGEMTYWFDGREMTVAAGCLCLFWGMVPHQVIARRTRTRFVCLYVPMSVLLGFPSLSRLRTAVFRGAMVEALVIRSYDRDIFMRWREELLSDDREAVEIVRSELTARVLRIERDGWRDLRAQGSAMASLDRRDAKWIPHIERMLRFIGEHAAEDISVADVARAANLHPNYAMQVFRRALGMTINQSIVRHRLDTAQSLLISTDLSVAEIAFESGFRSISRFYEAFHQRFASQPNAFRRDMRPKSASEAPARR
ncbi:helix-turn-helix domain-containing protein [Azospirillum griseum]|uniref:Helix-turn-helix domain-containing protein n=1 Tax=Azospirillum griseum TaxID=2496639 RepID=A0A431VDG2_9PROT|nr:helix-turn-helix domain-containing protein [Azospirillum griseum]RTR17092.1 helix-turn-helix domain-containing protein [Azospirillum griseum]